MSITHIEVDTAELNVDIRALEVKVRQLQQKEKAMEQTVNELETMWKGPAKEAFSRQFRKDCQRFKDICDVLEELISCLEHARDEYDKCEDRIGDRIASIHI